MFGDYMSLISMSEAEKMLRNNPNQVSTEDIEMIMNSISYLLKLDEPLTKSQMNLVITTVLPEAINIMKTFPNSSDLKISVLTFAFKVCLYYLKKNAKTENNQSYVDILVNIHALIKKLFPYKKFIQYDLRLANDDENKNSYANIFGKTLLVSNFLPRCLEIIKSGGYTKEIVNVLVFYSSFITDEKADEIYEEISNVEVSVDMLEIYNYLITLPICDKYYHETCERLYNGLSQLFSKETEQCIEKIRYILKNEPIGDELNYLKTFLDNTDFDDEDPEQVKIFASVLLYLTRKKVKTNEEVLTVIEKHHSLVKYLIPLLKSLPERIIEIIAQVEPKDVPKYAVEKFNGKETKFKDEQNIFSLILRYGIDEQISVMKQVVNNYHYLLEEIVYDLNLVDYEEENYLYNICELISETTDFDCNYSNLSNVILNSFDSIIIPYIFNKYDFLPINDKQLFIDLCPNSPLLYNITLKRKVFPEFAIKSEEYIKYAREAFNETDDIYFASKVAVVGIENTLQPFINKLQSVDFLIDAIEEDPVSTIKALEGSDLSGVAADDYENVVNESPLFLRVTHKATKYPKYVYDDNMKDRIRNSSIAVACYFLDCALEYADDKWWNDYEIPFSCKGTDSIQSQILILSKKRSGCLTQEEAVDALKIAIHEKNMDLFNIVFSFITKENIQTIPIKDLISESEEMCEIILMKVDVNENNQEDLIKNIPLSLLDQIVDQVEVKNEGFYNAVEERISSTAKAGIVEDFENTFITLINACDEEHATKICLNIIFSCIPNKMRTKEVMKLASKYFANNIESFSDALEKITPVKQYQSSPILSAFGELSDFISNSKSQLAVNARKAKLNIKPIKDYKSIEDILEILPDEFRTTGIRIIGMDQVSKTERSTIIHLKAAPSVKEALRRYTVTEKYFDENRGNYTVSKFFITNVSKYTLFSLTKYEGMILDKEIDLSNFMFPFTEPKTIKLAVYIGRDAKTKQYMLNSGTPVFAIYTTTENNESEFLNSIKDDEKPYAMQFIHEIDWEQFPGDSNLAFLAMNRFNSYELVQKYCNDSQFSCELLSDFFSEIIELNNLNIEVIKKLAAAFPEPDILILIAMDNMNDSKSIDNLYEVLTSIKMPINEMLNLLSENGMTHCNFINKIIDNDRNLNDEAIKLIMADKENIPRIMKLGNKKYIKYFLPIKDEEELKLIENNCSPEYAVSIIVENNNVELANECFKKYSKIPEFMNFINEHNKGFVKLLDMIRNPLQRKVGISLFKEEFDGFELDNFVVHSLEQMIKSNDYCLVALDLIEGHEKQFDRKFITGSIFSIAFDNLDNEEVVLRVLKMIQKFENVDFWEPYCSNCPQYSDIQSSLVMIFIFLSARNEEKDQTVWVNLLLFIEKSQKLSDKQLEFVANDVLALIQKGKIKYSRELVNIMTGYNIRFVEYFNDLLDDPQYSSIVINIIVYNLYYFIDDDKSKEYVQCIEKYNNLLLSKYLNGNIIKTSENLKYKNKIKKQDIIDCRVEFEYLPIFLHCFTNFLIVFPEYIEVAFNAEFINKFANRNCVSDLIYFLEMVHKHLFDVVKTAKKLGRYDISLYSVFTLAYKKKSWPLISRTIKLLIPVFNSEKRVQKLEGKDFSDFFSALILIPNDEKDLRYVYTFTEKLCTSLPDSVDLDKVIEFIDSFKCVKEEINKAKIVKIIADNSNEILQEVIVAEFNYKFSGGKEIPELKELVEEMNSRAE